MELASISLEPIKKEKAAVLGYGNQGRAHALNLRDSGVAVLVGARPGKGFDLAKSDGFQVMPFQEASEAASLIMFLLPDEVIGSVYKNVRGTLSGKYVGFAHGFSYVYGLIEKDPSVHYFLAGPKGAGAILRQKFIEGDSLPGVYAVGDLDPATEQIATSYAKAIGIAGRYLVKTTFQEETECDLFGEQTVLCGGIFELMEKAFAALVKQGHSPEMAFLETCFEAKLITDLWLQYGPKGVREKISPTAFYGGLTRGKRLLHPDIEKQMDEIFNEIRSGEFAKEWMNEVASGRPTLKQWQQRAAGNLDGVYQKLRTALLLPSKTQEK